MNKLNQHEVQFDYFSSNYDQFEKDFYKYSALNVPLTFLIDDILNLMVNNNSNFWLFVKFGAWRKIGNEI